MFEIVFFGEGLKLLTGKLGAVVANQLLWYAVCWEQGAQLFDDSSGCS